MNILGRQRILNPEQSPQNCKAVGPSGFVAQLQKRVAAVHCNGSQMSLEYLRLHGLMGVWVVAGLLTHRGWQQV